MEKQPTKKALKSLEQQRLLNEIKEIEEIIRINIESSSLKEELLFCVAKIKQTVPNTTITAVENPNVNK